ncbi:MAG TPA: endonuclease domain-containing protein [Ensifer sp.]|nr:endonuclease domain-containing protein [Ensifer sp.]
MPSRTISPKLRANAKRLRRDMTEAEARLWAQLRAHRLMGLKFRRQLPIAGYIADFACAEHKLIVELDGSQHAMGDVPDADVVRTRRLNEIGWTVVRFWNDDVMKDLNGACDHILAVIRERGSDV